MSRYSPRGDSSNQPFRDAEQLHPRENNQELIKDPKIINRLILRAGPRLEQLITKMASLKTGESVLGIPFSSVVLNLSLFNIEPKALREGLDALVRETPGMSITKEGNYQVTNYEAFKARDPFLQRQIIILLNNAGKGLSVKEFAQMLNNPTEMLQKNLLPLFNRGLLIRTERVTGGVGNKEYIYSLAKK